jgi:hypothetical protein
MSPCHQLENAATADVVQSRSNTALSIRSDFGA